MWIITALGKGTAEYIFRERDEILKSGQFFTACELEQLFMHCAMNNWDSILQF